MGSVSQIGWEWYSRLSELASVNLVTHIRNRACLQEAGAPLGGSEIIYIDTEWFAGRLYRLACRLFPNGQHAVFLFFLFLRLGSSAQVFPATGHLIRLLFSLGIEAYVAADVGLADGL
jgi:hypothetical protein